MVQTPARQYGAQKDPRRANFGGGSPDGATQYGNIGQDTKEPATKESDPTPNGTVVTKFHTNADTDTRIESIHHTLGPRNTQSSPGDHAHDGGTSRKLLEGFNLTGSKSSPTTMWPSILACLVRLGAKDNTTA